jgi:hypothetical protein
MRRRKKEEEEEEAGGGGEEGGGGGGEEEEGGGGEEEEEQQQQTINIIDMNFTLVSNSKLLVLLSTSRVLPPHGKTKPYNLETNVEQTSS